MTRVLNEDKTSGDGIKSNNLGDRTEGHSIHFEEEDVGEESRHPTKLEQADLRRGCDGPGSRSVR